MPENESGPTRVAEFRIPSEWAAVRGVQREVEAALAASGFADRDQFYIKVAMEEALANAVKHGNRLDPAKSVRVRLVFAPGRFEAHVADEGPGFDPGAVPDPLAPENLERPCGRGLLLIRKFMTSVDYHGRGNCLSIARDCPPG